MDTNPDEYALAMRARDGDRQALEELIQRTRVQLFGLAYAELRHFEDAQDAVAAALLRICRHVGRLKDPARAHQWMNSIVRNEARRLRQGPPPIPLSPDELDRPDPAIQELEGKGSALRLDIEAALKQLPFEHRLALRLFYLDDTPVAEIARRTGRPENTVKSWLRRGRRRLAIQMEEYAPMTPKPIAAIVHTSLEPDVLEKVTSALIEAGYEPRAVSPSHVNRPPALKEFRFIVVDERVGNRSGLEILVHVLTGIDTREIPVCLLCADPWDSTVYTCVSLGAALILNKKSPKSMGGLSDLFRWVGACEQRGKSKVMWPPFTERSKALVVGAQEIAAQINADQVNPEHLLLAILRKADCLACRVLEDLGADFGQLREDIERQLGSDEPSTRPSPDGSVTIHPRLKDVLDSAFAETRITGSNYLGSEHLLLGILWQPRGAAGQTLARVGISLVSARAAAARRLDQP